MQRGGSNGRQSRERERESKLVLQFLLVLVRVSSRVVPRDVHPMLLRHTPERLSSHNSLTALLFQRHQRVSYAQRELPLQTPRRTLRETRSPPISIARPSTLLETRSCTLRAECRLQR